MNLNRYSPAGIFPSFLLLDSLLTVVLHSNSQLGRVFPLEIVLVVEATLPQAVPSHYCPCTTVLAPVCLHSAASENSAPDFSFLLVPPNTQEPSFPFPKPRHRNVSVPSDSFQQIKEC